MIITILQRKLGLKLLQGRWWMGWTITSYDINLDRDNLSPGPSFMNLTAWGQQNNDHFADDISQCIILGCTVQVWEWISNFVQHFKMAVITYPCNLKIIYFIQFKHIVHHKHYAQYPFCSLSSDEKMDHIYPSGLHNMIFPVSVKQPWRMWINKWSKSTKMDILQ